MPRRSARTARAVVDELATELNASEGSDGGGATGSDSASEAADGSGTEAAAGEEVVADAPGLAAVQGVHEGAAAVEAAVDVGDWASNSEDQIEAAGDVGNWASDSEDEAGAGGGILGAAADYLLLAQPVQNIDPEQPAAPIQPAPMANIVAPQPVVQRMPPAQIMSLRVAQQGVNHGLEHGGLAFPMNELRVRQYLKDASRLSHVASLVFTKAPRSPASQTELLQTLDTLCRYVGAYNQAHITQEERTLLWMATHFTEGAASAFRASLATARTQPSTTGIGQGSVLWRALFHMVVMYDNPQSKQEGEELLKGLKWCGSVSSTEILFIEVFKNYQALVAATAGNPVATRAGNLSWEQKYGYIHAILPAWAKTRIRTSPETCDTEADLWRELYQHEPVSERGSGKMFQLGVEGDTDDEATCLPCDPPSYEEYLQWRRNDQGVYALLLASNGKPLKCWRCGGNHRLNTCLALPSQPEQQGQHFSNWPSVPPVPAQAGISAPVPTPLARPLSAPTMYVRPTINALSEDALGGRFDRLEATVATLAGAVAAMVQAPRPAEAPLPAVMALPAPPTPAPLLLVGHGVAPPGYIDVGTAADGRPLWARADEEGPVAFEALN